MGDLEDRCEPEIWCALNLGRPDPQKVQESLKNPSTWLWSGNPFDRQTRAVSIEQRVMVTDQEQRVPGRPSGEPAALLPSPNVLTTCIDERCMAFVNAALLVRILPSPRCCRLGDDDGLSSRDGKLHLSRDRTRSYHVLLIQDPLHVQGPLQSHRPSDRGTASLWPL